MRPADAARRALREARRGDAGAAGSGAPGAGASSVEPDSTAPGTRPAPEEHPAPEARPAAAEQRRGATEGAAAHGARPGDVAREALRRAAVRTGGGAAEETEEIEDELGAPGSGGTEEPDAESRGPAPDRPAASRPDVDSESPVGGPPDVSSGSSRPGDVAREALRAARTQAERERTAAQTKGVGSRRRHGGVEPTPLGPRPSTSHREAAAQVREMAERLGNTFELSSRMEREARTDEPDAEPGPTHPAVTPDADAHVHADADDPGPARRAVTVPGRSMAAPARDGELRRTFPALRVRPQGAGAFAETWWGNAWVAALEEMALDAARLGRGKAYAGEGHVDAITVTPGLVLAYVHGSRPRPYRVQIRMRTLSDDDWERFLAAAAERPSHIAALLDKDLPQVLADSGVELLPGPGDLAPHCSCPDSGHPCKHAAALCYQTARLLDEDPFVLLLLRGRGERELLDELSRRNATLAARSARSAEEPELPGVPAAEAVESRVRPPLPPPLPPPAHPEQPPAYPASPGGPDPFALDQLATDAAARAHALLTAGRDPLAELTLWQDAVRLAANRPGSGLTATTRTLYASLATAARRTPGDLARAVAAWRQGGLEGLAVLEEVWDPPAGRFDRARPLLLAADFPAFRPWHNHLTHPHGHIQLRLGHDGLWYAYESEPGHDDWWPRGTPDLDPVGALTGLGSPTDF
ncbi:SWIM zinc finger family protein [Streptomyces sp. NPDC048484]|uniref:SWIM zinc finger family protein n=1 Tax=Streptomyces sp. NPDC048484 TaxID=3155146 RepID=UPI003423761F